MKPLGILYYYRQNLRKVMPQLSSVALGVFLMFFTCILGGGLLEGVHNESISRYEKSSVLYLDSLKKTDNIIRTLKEDDSVRDVVACGWGYAAQNILISSTSTGVFFSQSDVIEKLMNMLDNDLIRGRLPANEGEAVVNEKTVNSLGLKIGDWFGDDVDDSVKIQGKHKIVGVYKGKSSYIFSYTKNQRYHPILIVIAKPHKLDQMNNMISKMGLPYDYLEGVQGQIDKMFQITRIFGCFILIIMMFVITFTVRNMNYIYFYNRSAEFALFQCLGQSRLTIAKRIFKEMAVISVIGFLIGIGLSLVGGWLFNALYAVPKGTPVSIFSWWYVLFAVFIPVCVQLLSLRPVTKLFKRTDFIEVLEGKA